MGQLDKDITISPYAPPPLAPPG